MAYYDSGTDSWFLFPGQFIVDPVNDKITVTTSHFTTFAIVLPLPNSTPLPTVTPTAEETPTPTSTPVSSDTTPPYTSGWNPAKGATKVPVNTNIVVHVKDDGVGVDFSTITMTVQGNPVEPTITGKPSDYTVTYEPLTDFGYNQEVAVTVAAQDQASTPNVMTTDIYNFTTAAAKTETKSGSNGNSWVWPAVIGGIGGALLIVLGAFLLMARRKRQRLA